MLLRGPLIVGCQLNINWDTIKWKQFKVF